MSARFYYPIDVIVDHPNPDFPRTGTPWDTTTNVYVGDAYCNKIRLIQIRNSSCIVYSFAGTRTVSGAVDGNTTMARFNRPSVISAA